MSGSHQQDDQPVDEHDASDQRQDDDMDEMPFVEASPEPDEHLVDEHEHRQDEDLDERPFVEASSDFDHDTVATHTVGGDQATEDAATAEEQNPVGEGAAEAQAADAGADELPTTEEAAKEKLVQEEAAPETATEEAAVPEETATEEAATEEAGVKEPAEEEAAVAAPPLPALDEPVGTIALAEPGQSQNGDEVDLSTCQDAIDAPLTTSEENDKGKAKATEENVVSPEPIVKPPSPTPSFASSKRSVILNPAVRYMLPIGGPAKRRPNTQGRSISFLNRANGGPSSSISPAGAAAKRSITMADFDQLMKDEAERDQGELSDASSSVTSFSPLGASTGKKRRPPARRLSSSDIPSSVSRSSGQGDDDKAPAVGSQVRRRSNTMIERSGKQGARSSRQRSKVLANGEPAKGKKLNRTGTTTSSMMVDGQVFFIDDEESIRVGKAQSARARSDTKSSVTTATREADKGKGGRRAKLLNRAADLGDMAFLTRAIRKPVRAQDEPMIYDADELDDIPPPGSYAIHPPSKRRLAEAADLTLFDEDGNIVRFGTIFEHQRTLIIFLRHWLCPFCQMFAQSIKNIDPLPLQRADLGLVVVGQGHAHVTKSYKQVMKIPSYVKIFADPTRKIYHALGMTLRTMDAGPACMRPDYQTMGVTSATFKAIKHGLVDMPIRLPGDTKLLGGEFILGPGLDCSFTHRMVTVRGHLDLPRILQQAGCDLSLKTPKDVLADNADASIHGPAASTKSVDRNNARRIARRMAKKARTATQKDVMMMRSKRAAEVAADLSQRGAKTFAGGVRQTSRTALSATFIGIDKLSKGSWQTTNNTDETFSMDQVEGKRSTVSVNHRPALVSNASILQAESRSRSNSSTRKAFSDNMHNGWSRKGSLHRSRSANSAQGRFRPSTADAVVEGAFAREQDKSVMQISRPVLTSSASWTEVTGRPATIDTLPLPRQAPPPRPRSSSIRAYHAARERQGYTSDEAEELQSDHEHFGVRGSLVSGQRSSVKELRRKFTAGGVDNNLSTASLGRSTSFRTQYQREQARRQLEMQQLLSTDKKSLRDRLEANSDPSRSPSASNGDGKASGHQRSSSTQSLPQASNTPTPPSPSLLQQHFDSLSQANGSQIRRNANGVPLSVFERGSLKITPRTSSHRNDAAFPTSTVHSPFSDSFGEDTDYKRLPRHSSIENTIDSEAAGKADMSTTKDSSGTGEDKTPKARIISLHADDSTYAPNSARTSAISAVPASLDESLGELDEDAELGDEPRQLASSPPPPPVPPKSPKMSAPLMSPTVSTSSYASRSTVSARAPMPAPTPAFAAILAAEEARAKGQSTLSLHEVVGGDKGARTTERTAEPEPTASTTTAAAAPTRLSTSSSMNAMPALLAGLPGFMSPPPTANGTAGHSRTQSQPDTLEQPPPKQQQPQTTAYSTTSTAPVSSFSQNGASTTSRSVQDQAPVIPADLPSNVGGASFLDDLDEVDGFNRDQRRSNGTPTLSQYGQSPLTAFLGGSSRSSEDEDDDEDDYRQDWEPLHARQNVIPVGLDRSSAGLGEQPQSNGRSYINDTIVKERRESSFDDEDEDYSENDTEEGDEDQGTPALALLGVLQNGAKRGSAVVKRVTSRPSTAPASTTPSSDDRSSLRSALPGMLTGSARTVRLRRKVPQTSSGVGRRLSSFVEEEEEEAQQEERKSPAVATVPVGGEA